MWQRRLLKLQRLQLICDINYQSKGCLKFSDSLFVVTNQLKSPAASCVYLLPFTHCHLMVSGLCVLARKARSGRIAGCELCLLIAIYTLPPNCFGLVRPPALRSVRPNRPHQLGGNAIFMNKTINSQPETA